jgi:RHS repeat-associated protein
MVAYAKQYGRFTSPVASGRWPVASDRRSASAAKERTERKECEARGNSLNRGGFLCALCDPSRQSGSGVHYYYNQNWQLIEERTLTPDPLTLTSIAQYVWGMDYIDTPVLRFYDGNCDGDCSPTTDPSDTIRSYLTDANHNVTMTITKSYGVPNVATTIHHYAYTAYGEATRYDSDWTNPTTSVGGGPLYCGYLLDSETGLYLARNRFYNSSLATWISRDPISYLAGMNLYMYVGDHPTIANDPTGMILYASADCV